MSIGPLDWPSIQVVRWSPKECPSAPNSGPPLFTWQEYYRFRNALLDVLSKYGTVGPMGKLPILETWELSDDALKMGTLSPDFFVVSDLYNYWNRWNRVEADPWTVTEDLLVDLIAMLMEWPGWCIYMALESGGLTVFSNRVLYEGEIFQEARSISDLAHRCSSTNPECTTVRRRIYLANDHFI